MRSTTLVPEVDSSQGSWNKLDRMLRQHAASDRPIASRDRRLGELKVKVLESLVQSGYAALAFVGCDIEQNRVILFGSVPSYHLKQLAQVYAQRVDGVHRIENRLAVEQRRPA
jgi:hypothetical protein